MAAMTAIAIGLMAASTISQVVGQKKAANAAKKAAEQGNSE